MPIYMFYWGNARDLDEMFMMEIDEDEDNVKRLLNEYRDIDKEYNNIGWLEFLEERNIKARILVPDYWIYF